MDIRPASVSASNRYQPLAFEDTQSFADRRQTHVEPRLKIFLTGKLGSLRDLAAQNLASQVGRYQLSNSRLTHGLLPLAELGLRLQ
jgi:hypothetical protein